jgi:hypothetical protein
MYAVTVQEEFIQTEVSDCFIFLFVVYFMAVSM